MKRLMIYLLVLLLICCAQQNALSPTETAREVAESFYTKDMTTLKDYTTTEAYEGMLSIQPFVLGGKSLDSNFKLLKEITEDEVAWVKFTTSYDPEPETFKLVKEDGKWKVTLREDRKKEKF